MFPEHPIHFLISVYSFILAPHPPCFIPILIQVLDVDKGFGLSRLTTQDSITSLVMKQIALEGDVIYVFSMRTVTVTSGAS